MSEFMSRNDFAMEKSLKKEIDAAVPLPPFNADKKKNKKKSGAFGIFRAALHILRKKPDEKKKQRSAIDSDNGDWKKIVGAMRPLHVQEAPESPMHQMSPLSDDLMAPSSPTASSSGTMSQYASALNLRDLDNTEEEEGDPDEVFDAITGDEEIDAKADEFIAQFYKQIQQQNSSRYQERGM